MYQLDYSLNSLPSIQYYECQLSQRDYFIWELYSTHSLPQNTIFMLYINGKVKIQAPIHNAELSRTTLYGDCLELYLTEIPTIPLAVGEHSLPAPTTQRDSRIPWHQKAYQHTASKTPEIFRLPTKDGSFLLSTFLPGIVSWSFLVCFFGIIKKFNPFFLWNLSWKKKRA